MMRAARGYNYLDALEHFQRLVTKVMNSRTTARGTNLQDLLQFTQQMMPKH